MDEEIKETLDGKIQSELENLPLLDEEGAGKVVNNLETLYKLRLEEKKLELEENDRYSRRVLEEEKNDRELKIKEEQLAVDKRNSWIKLGLGIFEVGVPLTVYAHFVKRGFKFEETGTFCSKTFMDLFKKISPKK